FTPVFADTETPCTIPIGTADLIYVRSPINIIQWFWARYFVNTIRFLNEVCFIEIHLLKINRSHASKVDVHVIDNLSPCGIPDAVNEISSSALQFVCANSGACKNLDYPIGVSGAGHSFDFSSIVSDWKL